MTSEERAAERAVDKAADSPANANNLGDLRATLVWYFRSKAEYRRTMGEQKPWTYGKNGNYAKSLDRVAAFVESLPDTDPTLKMLDQCPGLNPEWSGVFELPSRGEYGGVSDTDQAAIHCGPRGRPIDPADCAEWFRSWAQTAVDEASSLKTDEEDEDDEIDP